MTNINNLTVAQMNAAMDQCGIKPPADEIIFMDCHTNRQGDAMAEYMVGSCGKWITVLVELDGDQLDVWENV